MPLVPEDTGALRESGDVRSGRGTSKGRPGAHEQAERRTQYRIIIWEVSLDTYMDDVRGLP